ncbi:MAG TPA: response regulator [Ignavibacteriaceae bacterium]|nr:response regulator [Ignavibacteriaceae bacterium]
MSKKIILIGENEGIISLDLRIFLEKNYFSSKIVRSGSELIKQYKVDKPDLIITDLNLPGKVTVEEALREINRLDSTPVIILSGFSKSKIEKFSNSLSHSSFLIKPYDKKELLVLIRKYI